MYIVLINTVLGLNFRFKILIFNALIIFFACENITAEYRFTIDFWGDTINFTTKNEISTKTPFPYNEASIIEIQQKLASAGALEIVAEIRKVIEKKELCNWLVYQLIRKTSNQLIGKNTDYLGYTVTKWFLLQQLGFDPLLIVSKDRVLLYVNSNDVVYNIPYRIIENKQFICLNYHDYGYTSKDEKEEMIFRAPNLNAANFTFKITNLPALAERQYVDRELTFEYGNQKEHINIKLNTSLKKYFTNYPVTDYLNQFNIPLSNETKSSLIGALKDRVKRMSVSKGVEYIMYFTRYAFLFEKDTDFFGREKRLSPEETLLYNKSDCEDRSALFYALIKEIYNLPMIVVTYPDHVTVAVKLDKPIGMPIMYENDLYTLCEPTPQSVDLKLGEQLGTLQSKSFEIAFAYHPEKR